MTTTTFDQPTIAFKGYATLDGAPLKEPLILLDFDSIPLPFRIDPARAIRTEVDGWATPGIEATFKGPWRSCTPNLPINVEATVSCEYGSLYIESSADGATVTDRVCPGNVASGTLTGLTFTTSLPFYRVGVAPSTRGLLLLRSQQRTS